MRTPRSPGRLRGCARTAAPSAQQSRRRHQRGSGGDSPREASGPERRHERAADSDRDHAAGRRPSSRPRRVTIVLPITSPNATDPVPLAKLNRASIATTTTPATAPDSAAAAQRAHHERRRLRPARRTVQDHLRRLKARIRPETIRPGGRLAPRRTGSKAPASPTGAPTAARSRRRERRTAGSRAAQGCLSERSVRRVEREVAGRVGRASSRMPSHRLPRWHRRRPATAPAMLRPSLRHAPYARSVGIGWAWRRTACSRHAGDDASALDRETSEQIDRGRCRLRESERSSAHLNAAPRSRARRASRRRRSRGALSAYRSPFR